MTEPEERLARVTYLPGVQPPSGAVDRAERPAVEPVAISEALSAWWSPAGESEPARDAASNERAPESGEGAARRAENVALHALTRRGMSRREIERTLRARDLDEETIAAELERLERAGLVDDHALAQELVARLQERKGYGRSAIAAELARRLLAPAAIEYGLELVDGGDELERARELAARRASQLSSYDRETAVRRLSAYLSRRGYDSSTVRAAVRHALPA